MKYVSHSAAGPVVFLLAFFLWVPLPPFSADFSGSLAFRRIHYGAFPGFRTRGGRLRAISVLSRSQT